MAAARSTFPVIALALLAAATGVAGCSSRGGVTGGTPAANSDNSGWFGSRLGTYFTRAADKPAGSTDLAQQPAANIECPGVSVREGASTLLINPPDADPSPINLRYQGTIVRTARECAVLGATLTMRVGVQGRIILGPQGGPGQIEVPIRYALVKEGPSPRTVWTKLSRITVTIPPERPHTPFSHVEEDVTVPMPPGKEIDDYIVYVGFDPLATPAKPKQPERRRAPRAAQPRS